MNHHEEFLIPRNSSKNNELADILTKFCEWNDIETEIVQYNPFSFVKAKLPSHLATVIRLQHPEIGQHAV